MKKYRFVEKKTKKEFIREFEYLCDAIGYCLELNAKNERQGILERYFVLENEREVKNND